ncbi:hypothetical protein [Hymenobacter glacialis]|uniref:hypothetical protein n=1 Tax=Hymenobacter glacialis TaxID=1908236 RepID=UPI001F4D373B|nr:hypothetical protein [Hymenobacter glacialis]
MRKPVYCSAAVALLGLLLATGATAQTLPAPVAVTDAAAAARAVADTAYIHERYVKTEYQIPMRDGTKLYTIVYAPKDADQVRYPIMLNRTPYSVGPYGPAGSKPTSAPAAPCCTRATSSRFRTCAGATCPKASSWTCGRRR